MAELKPCPFCGGEAIITKHHNRFSEWWLVSCTKCHISQTGSEYEFSFEAIEAWNRRAEDGKKLTNGTISIGVYIFPDRKKPCLCYEEGNQITVYGHFNTTEGADEFMTKLGRLVGAEMVGEEDGK